VQDKLRIMAAATRGLEAASVGGGEVSEGDKKRELCHSHEPGRFLEPAASGKLDLRGEPADLG